jgi:hypothetical protein
MPLPQQVIEQLGRESVKTPGWSSGILFFSGTLLGIMVAIYVGLAFGYKPYLTNSIARAKSQIGALSDSISSADQAELVTYYSQISNLHALIGSHVYFSRFLTWLEGNTEANVYYGSLSFTSKNQVLLSVLARTQADVNQQIAVFESSPDVAGVSVPDVSFSPTAGMWTFSLTLILKPSLFLWQATSTAPAASGMVVVPVASTTVTTSTASTTTLP